MRHSQLLHIWSRLPTRLQWLAKWLLLPKHLLGVVAVILNDREELLVFKHSYLTEKPWGLPGGWVNSGERPADAIAREIKEESGCQVEVLRVLAACSSPRRNHVTVAFLCTPLQGEFASSAEVTDYRYLPLTNAEAYLEQSQAEIFAEIRSALATNQLYR